MKEQSTSRSVIALTISGFLVKAISIVYMILLLKILGDSGHGAYSKASEAFIFVYFILTDGISKGITKLISDYISKNDEDGILKTFKTSLRIMLVLGSLFTIVLYFLAPTIAKLFESPNATLGIKCLAPALFFTSLLCVYRGYFQGRMYSTTVGISQVVEQIANFIFTIGLSWYLLRFGLIYAVMGAALGTTLGSLFSLLYLIYIYKFKDESHKGRNVKLDGFVEKSIFNTLLMYAVPLAIGTILQQVGNIIDATNISKKLIESGLSQSQGEALYSCLSTYKQMVNVPLTMLGAITFAILPKISKLHAKGLIEDIKETYEKSMKIVFLISIPSAFGLSGIAYSLVNSLFINKNKIDPHLYYPNYRANIVAFGAFIIIFTAISFIQNAVLTGMGYMKISIKPLIAGIIIKITFNLLLIGIPSIRIYGVIISNIVTNLVIIILNAYYLKKNVGIKFKLPPYFFKYLTAGFIMQLVLIAILKIATNLFNLSKIAYGVLLIVQIIIGASVYMFIMIKTKGITKSEILETSPKLYKIIPNKIKSIMA